jgi:two-component sensor histidine kinase
MPDYMSDTAAANAVRAPQMLVEGGISSFINSVSATESTMAASLEAYRWIVAVICLCGIAALVLIPVAGERGPVLPSITPFFAAGVLATELSTSFLLIVWTRGARTWSLLTLACTYLFGSVMSVFHLLTFPGAVLPDQIILGTSQSSGWIFNIWYGGYGVLALIAIALEIGERRISAEYVDRAIALAVGGVLCAAFAMAIGATVGVDLLPPTVRGSSWTDLEIVLMSVQLAVLVSGTFLVLLVLRRRNVIFLLLSLVLAAMAFSELLSLAGAGRYTVGWSVGRLSWFLSTYILFFFFMDQFAKQQKNLTNSHEVLEERVVKRTAELTETVKRHDLLLRELHHRVKNKMQIVDALLATQARHTSDADARQGLQDIRSRVYVLALAHQHLMQSDLETFNVEPFLRELTSGILANSADKSASMHLDVLALMVTIDFAAPLGLLVTELVTDCLEHSLPWASGRITLTLQRNAALAAVVLTVSDNRFAPEFPDQENSSKAAQRAKFVKGLVGQLDGTMNLHYGKGSHVEIIFPIQEVSRCID